MKNKKEDNLFRNYESESVDITLSCRNYLLENNYFENKEKENMDLLERALINYSILKLAEWNSGFDKLEIENWDDLSTLLEKLNNHIPTSEEKEGFFVQYTRCIIYIYSAISKQPTIIWQKNKDTSIDFDYIEESDKLKTIITSKSVPAHEIPTQLLAKLKSYYPKKKNPVLEK